MLNSFGLIMDIFGFLILFYDDAWKAGWKRYLGLSLIVIGFALQLISSYI